VITLDTSGLIAYIGTQDRYHRACTTILDSESAPFIIPIAVLSEMAFMIERDFPPEVESTFLVDLREDAYTLDWNERDIGRIEQLTERYHDLPLGFADAAVIACAERHGGRILTTDFRHFPVVARGERTITVLPGP
jgi:predicted nucleic acid-binding protein